MKKKRNDVGAARGALRCDEFVNGHVLSLLQLLLSHLTTRWQKTRVMAAGGRRVPAGSSRQCCGTGHQSFGSCWAENGKGASESLRGEDLLREVKLCFAAPEVLHNNEKLNLDFSSCCH